MPRVYVRPGSPLASIYPAFIAAVGRLDKSLSPSDTINRLRRHTFTWSDSIYIFHLVSLVFWLWMLPQSAFPLQLLIPLLFGIVLLIPFTSQFFLRAIPVFAWLLIYFCSRYIPKPWRPTIKVSLLPTVESVLYGANISDILTRFTHPILDIVGWLPYGFFHFTLPFVVAAFVWLFRPKEVLHLWARVFGYLNWTGVFIQIVFPCAAPWYEIIHGLTPANYGMRGSPGGLLRIDRLFHGNGYTVGFSGAPVVFGAFPSLHAAQRGSRGGYAGVLYWATMYLSHHYLIDVVAGACMAIFFFYVFLPDEFRDPAAATAPPGSIRTGGRSKYELYDEVPLRGNGARRAMMTDAADFDLSESLAGVGRGGGGYFAFGGSGSAGRSKRTSGGKSHRHTASIASLIREGERGPEEAWNASPIGATFFEAAPETEIFLTATANNERAPVSLFPLTMADGFPWGVFSANTLRPMISDVLRSGGHPNLRLNKEDSLSLLQNIEKHGLEAALKEAVNASTASAGSTKRKHEEEELTDADIGVASSSEPLRKRGRPRRASLGPSAGVNNWETVSAPAATSRLRARNADAGPPKLGDGLLTRRQAALARGERNPSTRSTAHADEVGGSISAPRPRGRPPKAKPKSKTIFDAVELVKWPHSYVGKGKGKERATTEGGVDEEVGSDLDAEGEEVEVDGAMEPDTASSLQNSNKENEVTLTEIANADTDVDADGEDVHLPEPEVPLQDIGSPAPQITLDRPNGEDVSLPGVPRIESPAPQITVDHVEAARPKGEDALLPDDIGSPAPEITIEPMAEDDGEEIQFEPGDEVTVQFEGNGYSEENGHLRARPRLDIPRAGTPLNPEYSIEVYSPGSVQHDSDDEMWVINGINGSSLRPEGGGLGPLESGGLGAFESGGLGELESGLGALD
ncbi:acidPPc domain-containing protein [Mycena venus]|uniref:AcidPPc domain-containing protein n=1 Tax=Mycena venus TaxID=2733690 RepID=A0A8H6WUL9_9AGAR|nr:acidPPc domain-containing protein [Mycena venus]